jgi:hypothetical protein
MSLLVGWPANLFQKLSVLVPSRTMDEKRFYDHGVELRGNVGQ